MLPHRLSQSIRTMKTTKMMETMTKKQNMAKMTQRPLAHRLRATDTLVCTRGKRRRSLRPIHPTEWAVKNGGKKRLNSNSEMHVAIQ
jgi:hypothetical protein